MKMNTNNTGKLEIDDLSYHFFMFMVKNKFTATPLLTKAIISSLNKLSNL